ncbi:hypothetical protein PICSAR55_03157 [Mycobacterium avium subsp. paratuberculosis]|nr:hypothetical protein PICSAR55_03157 [Mycobacterium avium subsp. paratuberculosis]
MRLSTCLQKSATVDSGAVLSTSGTTPASIAGSVLDSGRTRRLTGKSSATSDPLPDQPRTNSAHAAVVTEKRRMASFLDSSLIRLATDGSSCTDADGE